MNNLEKQFLIRDLSTSIEKVKYILDIIKNIDLEKANSELRVVSTELHRVELKLDYALRTIGGK